MNFISLRCITVQFTPLSISVGHYPSLPSDLWCPYSFQKYHILYSWSRKLFRLCSSAKISDLHFSDSPFAACPYALLPRLLPLCLLVNPIRKIRNIFSEKFNKCSHFPFSHLAHRTKNYAPINPIATEPAAAAAVAPNSRCCSESRGEWEGIWDRKGAVSFSFMQLREETRISLPFSVSHCIPCWLKLGAISWHHERIVKPENFLLPDWASDDWLEKCTKKKKARKERQWKTCMTIWYPAVKCEGWKGKMFLSFWGRYRRNQE